MSDNLLRERKEKVVKYFKENKSWVQFALLAFIISLGWRVRAYVLPHLVDATTGQAISLELDSTLFLRYAEAIVKDGSLFSIDPLRYAPLGVDISNLAVFTSHFIAYLYKFLHVFNSSVTVAQANNLYPLVATAVISVFLFLLVRRLFEWKTALLSVVFLNFIPTFLFRSMGGSSDHDVLGVMFIVMAFYFYVCSWQTEKKWKVVVYAGLAALMTAFAAETAGSYTFILMVVGAFSVIEIFLNKFEVKDYYVLASYIILFTSFHWLFNPSVALSPLFTSVTTGVAYLALGIGTVHFLLFKKKILSKYLEKYKEKMPEGILSIILGLIIGVLVALVSFGPSFFVSKVKDLYGVIFKSFSYSRWALTVAENKTPFVADWMGQMGSAYVWLFIIGSVILFYDAVKVFKKKWYLTGVYTFFIFGYIFSRYDPGSILNGSTVVSKVLFYSAILLFIGVIGYGYFYAFRAKHEEFAKVREINKKYAFTLTWFLIMILAAASAIRLLFDFTPVTTILAALSVTTLVDYCMKLKNIYVKYVSLLIVVLVLFSPFAVSKGVVTQFYETSVSQSRGSGPGYDNQWQQTGAWVRQNTPANAVFAHWWDYGYWVQSGFERATITDGGNFFGWWNYLMGRNVLTGQSDEEALPFLKAHNATHLFMIADEVGKYTAFSSISSDKNYDRYSWVPTFRLDKQNSVEKRNETVLVYQGGAALDEDFIYEGKVYPAGQAGVGAVIVSLKKNGESLGVGQPLAALVYQNQRVDIPIRCIYFGDQLIEFEKYTIDACFRVIPTIESQTSSEQAGAGLWMSKRVYHSRFGQYYLLNKKSEHFKLVYTDQDRIPLAMYQGRLIGPQKIWEIKYPTDLKLSEEEMKLYLRTDYPDTDLQIPR
ncbi:MAG: STT3 domain-containing protein [Candidatus Nanoarchaeia archaeon]